MTSHVTPMGVVPVKVNNTQSISPPSTTPTTTPITNKVINNTTPTTNTVLPPTITSSPSSPLSNQNQNQNQNQDRLVSSSNNEIITQSSVIPSPQTIPIETSSSSSIPSNTNRNDKNALPVVAVVIIAIIGSVIGLFIVYRIYRRLFYKFQKHRSNKLTSNPDTNTTIARSTTTSFGYDHSSDSRMMSYNPIESLNQHQYHSKASLARHSIYYNNHRNQYHHVEEQISDLGSYTMGNNLLNQSITDQHYENRSMSSLLPSNQNDESQKTSPTQQDLMITLNNRSDESRQILLGPITRTESNGRRSPLPPMNPLLLTKDHSTLSTNTLKQATRRQSHQQSISRNGSTDFGTSMMDHRISTYPTQQQSRSNSRTSLYAGQQSRSNSRISTYASSQQQQPSRSNSRMSNSIGLPHLTKTRYQLTFPTPLSKPPETFMNGLPVENQSFQEVEPSGSNHYPINEFDINSFTQQQLHYQNDDHYGSIPLHSQIGSLSGEDHDEELVNHQNQMSNSRGNLKFHDPSVGTSPLDLIKIQYTHQPT